MTNKKNEKLESKFIETILSFHFLSLRSVVGLLELFVRSFSHKFAIKLDVVSDSSVRRHGNTHTQQTSIETSADDVIAAMRGSLPNLEVKKKPTLFVSSNA
jgi:hypothetical protein